MKRNSLPILKKWLKSSGKKEINDYPYIFGILSTIFQPAIKKRVIYLQLTD